MVLTELLFLPNIAAAVIVYALSSDKGAKYLKVVYMMECLTCKNEIFNNLSKSCKAIEVLQ